MQQKVNHRFDQPVCSILLQPFEIGMRFTDIDGIDRTTKKSLTLRHSEERSGACFCVNNGQACTYRT